VTESLKIPTIGIGAGSHVDAQILVWHDLLGFEPERKLKFVRRFMNFAEEAEKALKSYRSDVLSGSFPSLEESFTAVTEKAPAL
jgi:3-methyl-2-oxobutanoate hydroxymethyltransferase